MAWGETVPGMDSGGWCGWAEKWIPSPRRLGDMFDEHPLDLHMPVLNVSFPFRGEPIASEDSPSQPKTLSVRRTPPPTSQSLKTAA